MNEYFRGARLEKQEYRHLKENGKYVWVRLSVQMLPDPYSFQRARFDITKGCRCAKARGFDLDEPTAHRYAHGVLNRGAFLDAAKSVFTQPLNGGLHALVMVDVDHFKRINDKYDMAMATVCWRAFATCCAMR
jgi:hypothetical protein